MRIIHTPNDGIFETDNLEELKKKIEDHYNYKGYKPHVIVEKDYIIVDVDTELVERAEKCFQKAGDYCSKRQFNEANRMLEEAIHICPAYSEAFRLKAQIAMEHGQTEKAIDINLDALKADPNNVWALLLMGNLLSRDQGKTEGGRKYFDRALEIDPNNGIVINNLAGLLLQDGKAEEAIPLFDRALAINETYSNAYYGKASAYMELKDYRKAFSVAQLGCTKSVPAPENAGIREHLISAMIEAAKSFVKEYNYKNMIDGVLDLIYEVNDTPVKFVHDERQYTNAHLETAYFRHKDKHVLKYKQNEVTPHLMLHELAHLDMINRALKADRLKVVGHKEYHYQLYKKNNASLFNRQVRKYGEKQVDQLQRQIFDGITLFVMNAALDLFVEQKVYNLIDARPIQLLSLLKQEQKYIEDYHKNKNNNAMPPALYSLNKVLMMVGSLMLKHLYGVDFLKHYEPTKLELNQAQDLFDEYLAYEENFKDGDEYDLVDYFATSLNWSKYILISSEMPKATDRSAFTDGSYADEDAEETDMPDLSYLSPEEKERQQRFEEKHGEGRDPMIDAMMSMYMLGALEYFDTLTFDEVHTIAFQIAMLGVGGIDPNKQGYKVNNIPGKEFSGYQLLAYYYVSWKITEPDKLKLLGLPFDGPYETAKQMFDKKKGKK